MRWSLAEVESILRLYQNLQCADVASVVCLILYGLMTHWLSQQLVEEVAHTWRKASVATILATTLCTDTPKPYIRNTDIFIRIPTCSAGGSGGLRITLAPLGVEPSTFVRREKRCPEVPALPPRPRSRLLRPLRMCYSLSSHCCYFAGIWVPAIGVVWLRRVLTVARVRIFRIFRIFGSLAAMGCFCGICRDKRGRRTSSFSPLSVPCPHVGKVHCV